MKKPREMENADSNMRKIEYRELCETIRKRIEENIKKYNQRLIESSTENRISLK